jgi:hypothetical protein
MGGVFISVPIAGLDHLLRITSCHGSEDEAGEAPQAMQVGTEIEGKG